MNDLLHLFCSSLLPLVSIEFRDFLGAIHVGPLLGSMAVPNSQGGFANYSYIMVTGWTGSRCGWLGTGSTQLPLGWTEIMHII